MITLEFEMTREQLIDTISTLFSISHEFFYEGCHQLGPFNLKHRKERAVLDILSWELHRNIQPTKEEWIKTSYFEKYFTKEGKESYIRSVIREDSKTSSRSS